MIVFCIELYIEKFEHTFGAYLFRSVSLSMIRLFECLSAKKVCVEPNTDVNVPVYTKNIQIRDDDSIEFFESFSIEDKGLNGAGTKYDGVKLFVVLKNGGENSVTIRRGEHIGNILLEDRNGMER